MTKEELECSFKTLKEHVEKAKQLQLRLLSNINVELKKTESKRELMDLYERTSVLC